MKTAKNNVIGIDCVTTKQRLGNIRKNKWFMNSNPNEFMRTSKDWYLLAEEEAHRQMGLEPEQAISFKDNEKKYHIMCWILSNWLEIEREINRT